MLQEARRSRCLVAAGVLLVSGLLTQGVVWGQAAAGPTEPAKPAAKDPAAKEPAKDAGKEPAKDGGKADPAAADPDKDKPVVLKVVPLSIQMNGSVNFNENGVMNGQSSYFNIGFFLQSPNNMPIRSIRNMKVQKLVTDSGEDLTPGLRDQSGESFQMPDDLFLPPGQDRNRGFRGGRRQTYIQPAFPKKPCRKIARMQGTADIEMAQGPLKRVNVGKISDVDGKKLKIDGVESGFIQFSLGDEGNQRRLQVTSNASTLGKVARMYFFNADGSLIQNQGYSTSYSGQGNGSVSLGLYGQFPDTTTAVIIIYGNSKSMSVTFEGTDLPMPQIFAEGSDLFDMVLKGEPIEDGFALADIAPKPVAVDKGEKPAKPAVAKPAGPVVAPVESMVPLDIKTLEELKFTAEDDPSKPAKKAKPAVNVGVKQPAAQVKAEAVAKDKAAVDGAAKEKAQVK
jgi:hypothetical protein